MWTKFYDIICDTSEGAITATLHYKFEEIIKTALIIILLKKIILSTRHNMIIKFLENPTFSERVSKSFDLVQGYRKYTFWHLN